VRNEFESDGDLMRIHGQATPTSADRTFASGFSYTPDGRIQRLRLGNGRWESAKFNERLQVTEFALGASDGDATNQMQKAECKMQKIGSIFDLEVVNVGDVRWATVKYAAREWVDLNSQIEPICILHSAFCILHSISVAAPAAWWLDSADVTVQRIRHFDF
jgi:hypothetical protein